MINCFLAILIVFSITYHAVAGEKMFRVGLGGVSPKIDSHLINNAADHIILEHLLMPLVATSDNGNLVGIAVKKWKVSENHTKFQFELKDNLFFSNGKKITAENVKLSFERPLKLSKTLHFDFEKILSVTLIDELTLLVTLKNPDYFFLNNLNHPEFGILSKEDASTKPNEQDFSITSGPYSIVKKKDNEIVLKANSHWPTQNAINNLSFKNTSKSTIDELMQKEYDLIWNPTHNLAIDPDATAKAGYSIKKPRINFSFWISINPNLIETKDIRTRNYIQNAIVSNLSINKEHTVLSKADQLYFSDGPGRLSKSEIEVFRNKIKDINIIKPIKLKLLWSKNFAIKNNLLASLKNNNIEVEISTYNNFSEFRELTQNNSYHLIQVNNDFCEPDITMSLTVSFNKDRPLIIEDEADTTMKNMLHSLTTSKDQQEKDRISKKIGKHLLDHGLIAPLYYLNSVVLHKKEFDLSGWSTAYSDVSTWKIKK